MSALHVTIEWRRATPDFDYKTFDRAHDWRFSGGQVVKGSSAPAFFGDPALANPEEGLVASLSSCFMLTFLSIAALKRLTVDSYEDQADCQLGKNVNGKTMISRLTLRPKVVFGGDRRPDAAALAELYDKAKENCFVSNSLRAEVLIEPR